jgi:hypothetical protein
MIRERGPRRAVASTFFTGDRKLNEIESKYFAGAVMGMFSSNFLMALRWLLLDVAFAKRNLIILCYVLRRMKAK